MRWVPPAMLLVLMFLAACADEGEETPDGDSLRAVSTPSATPSASASPLGIEMQRGDDAQLGDLSVIVKTGCWQCDAPPSGLFRAAGVGFGARYDWLLRTDATNGRVTDLRGDTLSTGHILDSVSTPDGSVIAVSICVQGICTADQLSGFDPNSVTVTFRSLDGGTTWSEIDRRGPAARAVGVLMNGEVLVENSLGETGPMEFVFVPSDAALTPLSGVDKVLVAGDAVAGVVGTSIVLADGTKLLDLPAGARSPAYSTTLVGTVAGDQRSALVSWTSAGDNDWQIGTIGPGSAAISQVLRTRESVLGGGAWFPNRNEALITVSVQGESQPFPALIDMATGIYHLIKNPFQGGLSVDADTGRTIVVAAREGAFPNPQPTTTPIPVRLPDTGR